jgi:DNA-binding NarL/FixJ family response regulator
VLRLLAAGKFDQHIATTWRRSNGQKHVTHVLGKLGAADRTEVGTGPGSWARVP